MSSGPASLQIKSASPAVERVLVTGAAGFIGFHFIQACRAKYPEAEIVGTDNLNAYYSVALKKDRLALLEKDARFRFQKVSLEDQDGMRALFADVKPTHVVHLGAQAGVRYSLENPQAYIDSNITGTLSVLEGCRAHPPAHLIYASSSSVYGINEAYPFCETDKADQQASLYGATKKANESMAFTYAHMFGLKITGLRFFTVYGPWGRPDMAFFKFTKGILEGQPIEVYNHGKMIRDFTYVDDITEGMVRLLETVPAQEPFYALYNIGNGTAVDLMTYIQAIESALGQKADLKMLPMQTGDVPRTLADTSALYQAVGFQPKTPVSEGIERFVAWYRGYY